MLGFIYIKCMLYSTFNNCTKKGFVFNYIRSSKFIYTLIQSRVPKYRYSIFVWIQHENLILNILYSKCDIREMRDDKRSCVSM